MRPQTIRRDHTDMRRHGRITWRGVGAAYGVMVLVFAVIWAVSYPMAAATALGLVAGTCVAIVCGVLLTRRQAQRTICVPGVDVCFTI